MALLLRLSGLSFLILACMVLAGATLASGSSPAAAQSAERSQRQPGCTFQTLSPKDQSRYRSRYQRRVRIDGLAYADRWLREQACPTQAELDAKARRRTAKGKNCRAVSRPVTSMDGSMTVGIGRKCD